ncbi:lipase [Fusarium oxysporum f. sp. albedinis]|nr:lipase [Fusarium oxysporum f. sp. albedinis]
MATDMDNLNRFVAQKNLERLQHYDITLPDPASDSNAIIGDKCKLAYSILKKWSDKNPDSIKKAIEAQVFGQKNPIDWNIAFLPFMESMAVYLRDYGKILAACEKYAQCQDPEVDTTPEDLEDAISTYISAADEINNVAKLWGMKFMQICDLPRQGFEEQPKWSGPYCGAFYTTDAQRSTPFIGLAFKGTSPFNLREILVDKNYQLVQGGLPTRSPYNHIFEQLGVIAKTLPRDEGTTIRAHVTGHSLGGSYSSMCYAQLLIDASKFLPGLKMGDEYTFGAPRVGSNDWALMNRRSFYHTDQGVTIFNDKAPQDIASEINGPPPPGRKFTSWKEFKRDVIDAGPHRKFISRLL